MDDVDATPGPLQVNRNDGRPVSGRQIRAWVYGLAALLMLMSTASLTLIAHLSWKEADRRALEMEHARFLNAVEELKRTISKAQLAAIQAPGAYEALSGPLDTNYIRSTLLPRLRSDAGLQRTFVFDRSSRLYTDTPGGRFGTGPETQQSAKVVRLAEATREAYAELRTDLGHGLSGIFLSQQVVLGASRTAFAMFDDAPVLLSAVPILPANGPVDDAVQSPPVLTNLFHLDQSWMTAVGVRLGFDNMVFTEGLPERKHPTHLLIFDPASQVVGYFDWDHAKPGLEIWLKTLPLIVLLVTVIGAVAAILARKISRLSASLEQSERRNHYFARHDPLTGLPNRHQLFDRLAFAFDGLPGTRFAVIACDLDKFKPVNDTHGHEAGDTVLCVIAERLQEVIGTHGLPARIGGDEFILLVTGYPSTDALRVMAERLLRSTALPIRIAGGENVRIGISLGIAEAPACGTSHTRLIRAADAALYQAKASGRNTFRFAPTEFSADSAPIKDLAAPHDKQKLNSI